MKSGISWKSIGFALGSYWNAILFGSLLVLVVLFLQVYKLGTLTPAFSQVEISSRSQSATVNNIRTDPLQLPHKSLQFGLQKLDRRGPAAMRSVSVMFGLALLASFYFVLSMWYTRRIALMGGLLLASSSWFLHLTRLATPDIMFGLLFIFFACGVWLHKSRRRRLAATVSFLTALGMFYIPGMIWFILPLLVWQRRGIRRLAAVMPLWQSGLFVLLALVILMPLISGLITQSGLLKAWLGLPASLPGISSLGRNLINVPVRLFWQGPDDPARWLGSLPLVDWFGTVMFLVGVYAYRFKLHLDRTWFFIYVFIVGTILVALGGPVTLALLLPFVYIIISGGIALMLQQWFTVFPNNPFARGVGTTLLTLAVLTSCFYQLSHYFIAWPNTSATKAAFNQKP